LDWNSVVPSVSYWLTVLANGRHGGTKAKNSKGYRITGSLSAVVWARFEAHAILASGFMPTYPGDMSHFLPCSRVQRPVDSGFVTTHWSAVLAAREEESPRAESALAELCQTYWYPLYAYIRRRGYDPSEAEDLTQAFFTRLLQKRFFVELTPGIRRFRAFLLTSLKHFLANEWDRARRQKRGGGIVVLSLDEEPVEGRYRVEAVGQVTPETLFERAWASTVLEQVLGTLRQEFVSNGKEALFDQLKGVLLGNYPRGLYAEIAAQTGLTEGALKVAVHRFRRRYGELLRARISQTLDDPREVEDELRHLIRVLSE
jgi:RNA polymerase sigma-70 factor (ECF subfamily)